MRGNLHWWNAKHDETYEVELPEWGEKKVIFIDEKSGKFRKITMLPTTSGLKLHSGMNNHTNDDWATYIGEWLKTSVKGRWRRTDDVYGGEGEFELTPIP